MELVLDANVLFAALISDSHTRHLLTFRGLRLYAPELLFEEFDSNLDILSEKTGLSADELKRLLDELAFFSDLRIIPLADFKHMLPDAVKVSPDPGDSLYFALALYLNYPIWSNDKQLKNQNAVKIISTKELSELLAL